MEIPELGELDTAFEVEISRRPSGLRLPHSGARFRALRTVTVDVATYMRIPGTDSVVPIDIRRAEFAKSDELSLDYEPPVESSTHCSVIPIRYDYYEVASVKPEFLHDPQYVGYAFSVSYAQLHHDFDWVAGEATQDHLPIKRTAMAAWLKSQMMKRP